MSNPSNKEATTSTPGPNVGSAAHYSLFGRFRFQMPRGRPLDLCLDAAQTLMESAVYILGPFLILLALSITGLLSYTFFHVLLPMMMEKHAGQGSLQMAVVTVHCTIVIFLLVNILFNYAMCVTTKNDGPVYDRVVRELAGVTGFCYPETPAQTLEFRRDFEDRMVIRMRRRRAREEQAAAALTSAKNEESVALDSQALSNEEGGQTVTQRKGATVETTAQGKKAQAKNNASQKAPSTVVRRWMLMGPYEWGFCGNSMQPKPPRSHYDHVTKKLVLNLDVSITCVKLQWESWYNVNSAYMSTAFRSITVLGFSMQWDI